ncbi:putative bifunctional diguanylate cyclase/phosphodiesterase [Yoonia sp. 208BN28-4]|uniref:putative bifunctional diguanylate cyclase/phosphodiesterase n=1 Tax=Yoonia sp. 208BN28-4 TaxID=3126505 RepID=UPI00309FB49A
MNKKPGITFGIAADLIAAHKDSFFRIASQHSNDGIVLQDMHGIILWANPAYAALMGRDLHAMLGRNPLSFCLPEDETPSAAQIAAFRYDPQASSANDLALFRNRHGDGHIFWNQINQSFHQFPDGMWISILACRDVSEQISKEEQLMRTRDDLARLAATDALTSLANRSALTQFLDNQLARKGAGHLGILQVDLDKFKTLNDHFGHAAGDAMLVHVAGQLRKTIRKTDLAARIGGDEFVVVCPDITSLAELQIIGASVAQAIGQPLRCSQGVITGQACVGAAMVDDASITAQDIMRRVNAALYEAKSIGQGSVAIYDSTLHKRITDEDLLSSELMTAVSNDALSYYFQPIMSLEEGDIVGLETLVRWHHPRLGLIPPDSFLPVARKLGLMAQVDFGAMRAALAMKQKLNAHGPNNVRVTINGSAELLRHPDFFTRLSGTMAKRDVTAKEVVIEVLESVVIHDQDRVNPMVTTIKRLADEGFTTLLDDFGTGHAGLAHLSTLAVGGVKIDRSMTSKICDCGPDAKIIAMIHDLCEDLGFYVVTEGIETDEDAATLIGIGGKTVQGYWLAKPMPADDVIPWLTSRPDLIAAIDRSAIAPVPRQRYLRANS